jgi:predicted dehydrogenase
VSCQGSSHVTRGIEDVTMMNLNFRKNRCAFIHNSWLDPKKVRQMTVVGSQRMIVYDDTEPLEKLKIYDARVEVPPHYDTFAEFTYSYHYGDSYVPYIKQDEPLKLECQHFLQCIAEGSVPITNGRLGLEVVKILEASSESLRQHGAAVDLGVTAPWNNGHQNGHGNGKPRTNGNGNGHAGVVTPATNHTLVAA